MPARPALIWARVYRMVGMGTAWGRRGEAWGRREGKVARGEGTEATTPTRWYPTTTPLAVRISMRKGILPTAST